MLKGHIFSWTDFLNLKEQIFSSVKCIMYEKINLLFTVRSYGNCCFSPPFLTSSFLFRRLNEMFLRIYSIKITIEDVVPKSEMVHFMLGDSGNIWLKRM